MKKFKHYVEEASFSRINTHLKSDRPVGMMTAFRGTYTYQDNKKKHTIDFLIENPISPLDNFTSPDGRKLGILIKSIKLIEENL